MKASKASPGDRVYHVEGSSIVGYSIFERMSYSYERRVYTIETQGPVVPIEVPGVVVTPGANWGFRYRWWLRGLEREPGGRATQTQGQAVHAVDAAANLPGESLDVQPLRPQDL